MHLFARHDRDRQQVLLRAPQHYDGQIPGLGDQFVNEVESVAAQIVENPEAAFLVSASIRRRILHRFPSAESR